MFAMFSGSRSTCSGKSSCNGTAIYTTNNEKILLYSGYVTDAYYEYWRDCVKFDSLRKLVTTKCDFNLFHVCKPNCIPSKFSSFGTFLKAF